MTFGIPVSVWPLGDDNRMSMEGFNQMITSLRQQEEERTAIERGKESCGIILFPKSNDVLLGRGRPYRKLYMLFSWDIAPFRLHSLLAPIVQLISENHHLHSHERRSGWLLELIF